jgi:antitoxin component YwqK of YwqJK toxin-antitoxin module
MNPIDPDKFSFDYLLENQVITILSWDYVIEHGINYEETELQEITRCHREYMCYPERTYPERTYPHDVHDYSGLFSGLLYEIWDDLNLRYYTHYKDGLRDGVEVEFYDSGKVKNYCVWDNNGLVGKYYKWYENGKIKVHVDCDQDKVTEFDEQGNITKQTD